MKQPWDVHRQRGLSLVELMVAMLIGLILMLGLVQVFAASRTSYQLSEGLSRVQENGRFAMDYLQRDIRMAGHYGCVNDQAHKQRAGALLSHTSAALPQVDFSISLQGYEATGTAPGDEVALSGATSAWSPALPGYLTDLEPLAGSDIIVLRYLYGAGAPVTALASPSSTQTNISIDTARWANLTDNGVATPTLFAIADCSNVDVFVGAGNAVTGVVEGAAAMNRYTPHPSGQTVLYRAEAVAYYVAEGASGERALYRTRWNGAGVAGTEELVEGVESLQFLYGLDSSIDLTRLTGFVSSHQTATALGDATTAAEEENWRRVGMVRLGILAGSPNSAAARDPENPPQVLGVDFTAPTDGRYRSTYESSIALRNRLYGN